MTTVMTPIDAVVVLRLPPGMAMSDDQLFEFCQINEHLRIERTAEGDLVIMPPECLDSGMIGMDVAGPVWNWAKANGTGVVFSSSAAFTLPNGAMRSSDVAWIRRERWEALPREERRKFGHICPDFVVEVRSPSDSLRREQAKMQEYIDNGARLGWLIDPLGKQVYVYRPGAPVERLDNPETVSGDPVLPGFVLEPRGLWEG